MDPVERDVNLDNYTEEPGVSSNRDFRFCANVTVLHRSIALQKVDESEDPAFALWVQQLSLSSA